MGEYAMNDVPFKETFLHGLIYGKSYWRTNHEGTAVYVSPEEKKSYDLGTPVPANVESKWEKMSKTKGNVIDPLEIIHDYGTDALRMALTSSVTHARQIDLDLRRFEEFKNFANKVWNGSRFVFMNLEDLTAEELAKGLDLDILTLEDRWILSVLNRTIAEMNKCLEEYTFDRAAARSYEFFWNDFCAVYVELAKPVLFSKAGTPEARKNKQKLLVILLSNAIRLMHPIAPFITEEIFSNLKTQFSGIEQNKKADAYTKETISALLSPACIQAPYPTVLEQSDLAVEKKFEQVNELVRAIRNIRAEMQIPPQEKTELHISGQYALAEENQAILLALTPTAKIAFSSQEKEMFGASSLVGTMKLTIPIPDSLRVRERARLEKELEKAQKLLEGTQGKLKNEEFRAKAPKEVVEKLEAAEKQTDAQIREILTKLEKL